MTIKILDVARDDLRDGYHFYEKQRAGLGHYFLENLTAGIESLKFTGGTHPVIYKSYFRALSKCFSWAIYYSMSQVNL